MRKFPIFLACMLVMTLLLPMASGLAMSAMPQATMPPVGGAQTEVDDVDDVGDVADEEGGAAGDAAEDGGKNTPPATAPAATPEPTAAPVINNDFDISVDMGYDGLIIMNKWMPSYVTVTNNGADFDGILGVNIFLSLTEYDRYEIPLTLAGGATKRILLPFTPMMRQDMYAFELVKDGRIVAEMRTTPTRIVNPEAMSVGLLSETPESLAHFNQKVNGMDTMRGELWMTIPLTPETFPETAELMQSFSMLVVDGIDVRTLSEAQQSALSSWLHGGGILFVNGGTKAAAGYPFFSEWTGLTAGAPAEAEDITEGLLSFAGVTGDAVGEPVWLSPMATDKAILQRGEQGLISLARVGNGLIYSLAFDAAGKPMSGWRHMGTIWPRMLYQTANSEYMTILNNSEQSRYGGQNDAYSVQSLVSSLRVENTQSGWPVILILIAYIAVVGFGGYIVLKRFDKREWLWVAAPVSAIVFALLMFLLSRGTTMNKPVTLTASRVVLDSESSQTTTYIGVATPQSGEMNIETDQGVLPTVVSTESYWYYDDNTSLADRLYRPQNLRQRNRFGDTPAVGFQASEAWDAKMLKLANLNEDIGTLNTSVWLEADGLHGKITNNTEYVLRGSFIVSSFGYSMVDDILPGQTVEFEMLYPKKTIDMTQESFTPEPNTMYSTLDVDLNNMQNSPYSYYFMDTGVHRYIDAAIYGKDMDNRNTPENQQKLSLIELFNADWRYYEETNAFYLFAFNDTLGRVQVLLDGTPVTRTAHTAVLGSKVPFEPIGPTGHVMYPQGMIRAEVIIDQGEDSAPRLPRQEDGLMDDANYYGTESTYVQLTKPVALRYLLPEWGKYSVEKLSLVGMSYESIPTMYLYNHQTKQWDEQLLLMVSMDDAKLAPYVDKDGQLFVRLVPSETATRYEGMQVPSLALKGVMK